MDQEQSAGHEGVRIQVQILKTHVRPDPAGTARFFQGMEAESGDIPGRMWARWAAGLGRVGTGTAPTIALGSAHTPRQSHAHYKKIK